MNRHNNTNRGMGLSYPSLTYILALVIINVTNLYIFFNL